MRAAAPDHRHSSHRTAPGYVPVAWLAVAAVVVLGLLLIAGGGPLRPALATFAVGALAAMTATWLHGAATRWRGRRRAELAHATVMREGIARLRDTRVVDAADLDTGELLAALAALADVEPAGAPRSLAAAARSAAAAARAEAEARDVRVLVAVDRDTHVRVAGLDPALRGLLRHALRGSPPGSTVTAAIRRGRIELNDDGSPAESFAADVARAIAQRAGGDLHVFADGSGTLSVLELPESA